MSFADPSLPAAGQRWLVVAPHPDDETLGAGGLLQRAHGAGAAVRVLRLTDGEANPWPQRWLERRWRIDAAARARWAARRRAECEAALFALGLDPVADLVALGWPDGGVTDRLFDDTADTVAAFRAVVDAFAPTHLVVPAADDRHPDHNVVPVIAALALGDAAPRTLAYRVHGGSRGDALTIALTPAELDAKRRALACHRTQLALSARRFEARVDPVEAYDADAFGGAASSAVGWSPVIEGLLRPVQGRWRWRFAGRDAAGRPRVAVRPATGSTDGRPPAVPDLNFMKLEPGRRGPWIYDSHGWDRRADRAP
jgi:LmbE family N-acetylglucosaminyl deacetylase